MGLRAVYECENCKAMQDGGPIPFISVECVYKDPRAPWLAVSRDDWESAPGNHQFLTYCSLKCVAEAGEKEAQQVSGLGRASEGVSQ